MFQKFTSKKNLWYFSTLLGILAMLILAGCDENITDDDIDALHSVTFNLTIPEYDNMDDLPVTAYLFESEDDDNPYKSEQATISNSEASITLEDIEEGEYVIMVVVSSGDSSNSEQTLEKGDMFWGALDVDIDDDETITITEDYWQRFHSVLFGIRGIPSGHTGEVIAAGIIEDGADWTALEANLIWGTYTVIYNTTAILAPCPIDWEGENEWMDESLPADDYDVLFLLDVDGSPDDYQLDGPYNPISDDDYMYQYNYTCELGADDEDYTYLTSAFTPVVLTGNTLTINYELPPMGELSVEYDEPSIVVSLWDDFSDDDPVRAQSALVEGNEGTVAINCVANGTYHILVAIKEGFTDSSANSEGEDDPHGFLFWGALDFVINSDNTINVEDKWWQWTMDIIIGVKGIPNGNNGEQIMLQLFPDSVDVMGYYGKENLVRMGMGTVFNNASLVGMIPPMPTCGPDSFLINSSFEDSFDFELESGSYQLVALIDQNFDTLAFNPDDSTQMYNPFTIGEPFAFIDYTYNSAEETDKIQILTGSFSEMVGITGSISCSLYTGGDIYIVFSEDNKLDTTETSIVYEDSTDDGPFFSFDVLSDTSEEYGLAVFPGVKGFVLGLWDVDGSGLFDGPNSGDYVGVYPTFDSPDTVTCGVSGTSDIDFSIDIPVDSLPEQ